MADLHKLKSEPPSKFSGTENWERWSRQFKNWIAMANRHYIQIMDNAEAATQQIDDALIATWDPTGQPAGMARDLATSLHYLLTKYTTSGANQFVDNIPNQNGLVTWHALSARYKLPGVQIAIMAMTQVMSTKFTDKDF